MAARVTAVEVQNIIETDLSTGDIDAYISAATTIVDATVVGSLGDALLKEIERWLAAHYIASTREQMVKKAEGGPASATFFGKDGLGLNGTPYGQQAIALDPTGKLSRLNKGTVAAKLESM